MATTDHPPSDEPAFPREDYQTDHAPGQRGMSMRDYFAAKAMQGLLANPGGPIQGNGRTGWGYCNTSAAQLTEDVYALADAMLAARAKP